MAKDAITDYSATPSENTDVGGINILGSAPVSNFDDALRELMSQLADMNSGASPLDATFKLQDPDNNSRQVSFDVTGLSAANNALPLLALSRGGSPKVTTYTSSGTHTFASGSKRYQIISVGGGGSGRAAYASAPSGQTYYAAGSGGQSGQFSTSTVRSIAFTGTTAKTATVTIGAGGTSVVNSSGVGTNVNGGDTVWVHDTLTLTSTGGGSAHNPATGSATVGAYRGLSPRPTTSNWLFQSQNLGGVAISGITTGVSGAGGSSLFGAGGNGQDILSTAGGTAGIDGQGYGAGGGGAIATATSGLTHYANGGAGSPGILIVMEW